MTQKLIIKTQLILLIINYTLKEVQLIKWIFAKINKNKLFLYNNAIHKKKINLNLLNNGFDYLKMQFTKKVLNKI